MAKARKAKNSRSELGRLRIRLAEAEKTIAALREGTTDEISKDGKRAETELRQAQAALRRLAAIVTYSNDAIIGKALDAMDVLYNATLFKNEKGEPEGVFAAARDVTDRKRAEEQLRQASLYTRSLIEASLDPLVTISKEGKITDVNEATEKATGLSRQKLIGSNFSVYFTEPEKADQGYRGVFADGYVRDYPLALRHTSGSLLHVLYNATVFRNPAGEVEGVFAAARDITRRKQVEEELRTLNAELEKRVEARTSELRESESRIRRKLDSILAPEGDLADLEVTDILDISAVQTLAEDFFELTNIPLFMVDLKGTILVGGSWQDICTRFQRVNSESRKNCLESDLVLSHGVVPGEFKLYKCKNNMWDAVTPLMLGDKHIANIFTGQFFFSDEPIDYELFRAQARTYGFDEQQYMAALDQVPRLSREQVDIDPAITQVREQGELGEEGPAGVWLVPWRRRAMSISSWQPAIGSWKLLPIRFLTICAPLCATSAASRRFSRKNLGRSSRTKPGIICSGSRTARIAWANWSMIS